MYTGYQRTEWIRCGEIDLFERDSHHHKGVWQLKAFLDKVTDFEHDSASAFRFELVGVEFNHITYGGTTLSGWIKAGDPEAFRVSPDPNYNPLLLKGTTKCRQCKGKDSHLIVPEGYYIPPIDEDFYNLCSGRKVEIRTGVKGTTE
jgi:hypothetical protein